MLCETCHTPLTETRRFSFCPRCSLEDALASSEPNPPPGDTLAGYEIFHELGHGGMGTVWLARERRLDRLVALKKVPASSTLARRLVSEGRAAAQLDHPNIVKVYASGESGDTAFLAMEYLDGGNLDEARLRRPFLATELAELVRNLANGLQYAHANGVLHRDLKPSNVLLDGSGEPHLGDFGLAAPVAGGGELTAPGQIAGTLAYMAPELVQGDRATPASDIYGLGAVLYTCLAGRAPYLGDSPVKLLGELSTSDPPSLRSLNAGVPRDLETICLKCLRRAPRDRYPSALALEDDLGRFLRGEPVAARPVSGLERAARWCNRNRATAAFVGLLAAVLVALAVGGPWVAVRFAAERRVAEKAREQAEHAEHEASSEAASAKAVSDFLQNDLLAQAAPDNQPDRELKLRTVLERAAKRVDGSFREQPLVEARVRVTLGDTFVSLTEYAQARQQYEPALAIYRSKLGADDPLTLRTRSSLTGVYVMLADYKLAQVFGDETLQAQRRVVGAEHPDTLKTMSNIGTLYLKQARYPEAESLLKQTLGIQTRVLGEAHLETLKTRANIAALYLFQGRLPESEAAFASLVETMTKVLGAESPATLKTSVNLAIVYAARGKLTEAEILQKQLIETDQRVLGPDHANTLSALNSLAVTYRREGKMLEAETLWRRVYESTIRTSGPDHPDTLKMMNNLTVSLVDQSKFADAETMSRSMLAVQSAKLGAEHPDALSAKHNLAVILWNQGKFKEAESLEEQALVGKRRVLGPDHVETFETLNMLAVIYWREGRLPEADKLETETSDAAARVLGEAHETTRMGRRNLGQIYQHEGKLNEAEAVLRRVLDLTEGVRGSAPDFNFSCADALGETLVGLQRYAEAEVVFRRALDGRLKTAPTSWQTAKNRSLLGETLLAQKRFDEAELLLVAGYGDLVKNRGMIPPVEVSVIQESGERVLRLFTAWNKDQKVEEWRALLSQAGDRAGK